LVNHKEAVMLATDGEPAALAAKAATSKIPIVFGIGGHPVKIGLVDSLNRLGGNATGVSRLTPGLDRKRPELLRELMPKLR
jgi:putative tryptophan/tyrosine transport system substrate-binding protein